MLSLARTSLHRAAQLARPSPVAAFRFPTSAANMSTTAAAQAQGRHNPWAQALPKPAEELNTYLANLPDFTHDSKRCGRRELPASLSARVAARTRHATLITIIDCRRTSAQDEHPTKAPRTRRRGLQTRLDRYDPFLLLNRAISQHVLTLRRNSQGWSDLCRRLSRPDDGFVVPASGRVARQGAGTVVAGRLRDGRRVGHEQGGFGEHISSLQHAFVARVRVSRPAVCGVRDAMKLPPRFYLLGR